jgi:hypothetical protein
MANEARRVKTSGSYLTPLPESAMWVVTSNRR